jgi:hypothetical protein
VLFGRRKPPVQLSPNSPPFPSPDPANSHNDWASFVYFLKSSPFPSSNIYSRSGRSQTRQQVYLAIAIIVGHSGVFFYPSNVCHGCYQHLSDIPDHSPPATFLVSTSPPSTCSASNAPWIHSPTISPPVVRLLRLIGIAKGRAAVVKY